MAWAKVCGVIHGPAVLRPRGRGPDLGVVTGADDERSRRQADPLAQVRRQQDTTLLVELRLGRAGEDAAAEEPGGGVGHGELRDLVRQECPAGKRMDGEAAVDPARDDGAAIEQGAELRRDGDAPLVVHRVPVLAGEHRLGHSWSEVAEVSTGPRQPGREPVLGVAEVPVCPSGRPLMASGRKRFPTSPHFAPLRPS